MKNNITDEQIKQIIGTSIAIEMTLDYGITIFYENGKYGCDLMPGDLYESLSTLEKSQKFQKILKLRAFQ